MKIEIFDARSKEWREACSNFNLLPTAKLGGIIVSFRSDPNASEEGHNLRIFRQQESVEILDNPPPGLNIRIITEYYSVDLQRQFNIVYQIYSTDGEEAGLEWFKTIADLLAMFGKYFVPAKFSAPKTSTKPEPPPIRIIKEGEDVIRPRKN